MIRTDTYMRIVLTIIALCLMKLAFFSPPQDSYAQLPFLSTSDKPIDVNIKSIDDQEFIFSKSGDVHMGGKKGPLVFQNGALMVRITKDLTK